MPGANDPRAVCRVDAGAVESWPAQHGARLDRQTRVSLTKTSDLLRTAQRMRCLNGVASMRLRPGGDRYLQRPAGA